MFTSLIILHFTQLSFSLFLWSTLLPRKLVDDHLLLLLAWASLSCPKPFGAPLPLPCDPRFLSSFSFFFFSSCRFSAFPFPSCCKWFFFFQPVTIFPPPITIITIFCLSSHHSFSLSPFLPRVDPSFLQICWQLLQLSSSPPMASKFVNLYQIYGHLKKLKVSEY